MKKANYTTDCLSIDINFLVNTYLYKCLPTGICSFILKNINLITKEELNDINIYIIIYE